MILIEQENPFDFPQIYYFVQTAFATADVKEGNEQDVVEKLRKSRNYVAELALVAKIDGEIVGYAMATKTPLCLPHTTKTVLNVGPVAVALPHRRQKIGSLLVQELLRRATQMDFESAFLAGNPNFYKHFGFVPTFTFGISCNVPVPPELAPNIMCIELKPNALANCQNGVVTLV